MNRILKLVPVINKSNGQINTCFPKKKLPKEILDSIKKQPNALKKILVEIKGAEYSV